MNIVIVAGGENTRFKEMSIFPKILLPTLTHSSILEYNCELFKDHNIYLIINNKYYDMVRQYIEKTKLNINLICSKNHNGSANTIKEIHDQLPKKNILFIWSDLILDKIGIDNIINDINTKSFCSSNIIFTYNGQYRFKIEDNIIKPVKNNGNIPGIYFVFKMFNIKDMLFPDNFDYIEIFQNYIDSFEYLDYKGHILEFKDLDTYIEYYKNDSLKTTTRFFNKMIINKNRLIKMCINENYNHLIEREIKWYEKCINKNYKNIPNIYHANSINHTIEMEYLKDYQNIYEFIKNCNDQEFNIFMNTYLNTINNLHNIENIHIDYYDAYDDYKIEYYDKVIKRCNSISSILYKYNEKELKKILSKAFDEIINLSEDICNYCFIHGDLNGSNVMYNKNTNQIKFIDPRGYFGDSQLIGSPHYDFAKVAYCLSGYDDFNNGRFKFTSDWYDEPKILRQYKFNVNNKLYSIIVGIIWISLAEYISQDVFKANIAYYHGLKILKNIL